MSSGLSYSMANLPSSSAGSPKAASQSASAMRERSKSNLASLYSEYLALCILNPRGSSSRTIVVGGGVKQTVSYWIDELERR